MSTEVMSTPRAIVLDDDPSLLEAMQLLDETLPISFLTTDDPNQSLDWLDDEAVDTFVADLRMPGKDGVTVLEEAYRRRPSTALALLTSHELTRDQDERLRRIGATHYAKMEGLPQLLADIVNQPRDRDRAGSIKKIQERVEELEQLNRELIQDFIAELQEIPDAESQVVHTAEAQFTVAELIGDLENLTPRGIEHLRLWLRAFDTLRRVRGKS